MDVKKKTEEKEKKEKKRRRRKEECNDDFCKLSRKKAIWNPANATVAWTLGHSPAPCPRADGGSQTWRCW